MLVEIEGYEISAVVWGKKCDIDELRKKMLKTWDKHPLRENFVALFCRMWSFEEIPHVKDTENIMVNFVMDVDTYSVYKPYYSETEIE